MSLNTEKKDVRHIPTNIISGSKVFLASISDMQSEERHNHRNRMAFSILVKNQVSMMALYCTPEWCVMNEYLKRAIKSKIKFRNVNFCSTPHRPKYNVGIPGISLQWLVILTVVFLFELLELCGRHRQLSASVDMWASFDLFIYLFI